MEKDIFTLDNFMRILIVLILISIFCPLYWLARLDVGVESPLQPFNSKEWKSDDNGEGVRESMVEDLAKNYLKINMSKSQIINLLGKPNCQRCGLPQSVKIDTVMCYYVSRGFDACSLDIYLNNLGKLTSFKICCN